MAVYDPDTETGGSAKTDGDGGPWLMSMADLLCILTCFFVLHFAMGGLSRPDPQQPVAAQPLAPWTAPDHATDTDVLAALLKSTLDQGEMSADWRIIRKAGAVHLRADAGLWQRGEARVLAPFLDRLHNRIELIVSGHAVPAARADALAQGLAMADDLAQAGLRRSITVLIDPTLAEGPAWIDLRVERHGTS